MSEIIEFNVVVATSDLKASKFTQNWLIRAGVLQEDDVVEGGFFTPVAIAQTTSEFNLAIVPGRIQLKATETPEESKQKAVVSAVEKLLKACGDGWVTISAVGVNIHFALYDDSADYWKRSKVLFADNAEAFTSCFDVLGATGAKKLHGDVQAQLEMKPMISMDGKKREGYVVAFNFNRDTDQKDEVYGVLSRREEFAVFAKDVVAKLEALVPKASAGAVS